MSLKPYNIGVSTEVSGKSNPTIVVSRQLSVNEVFMSPKPVIRNEMESGYKRCLR